MKISERLHVAITTIVAVGMVGCGAPPDGSDWSPENTAEMAAPSENGDDEGGGSDEGGEWAIEEFSRPEAMVMPGDVASGRAADEIDEVPFETLTGETAVPPDAAAPESTVGGSEIPPSVDEGYVQEKVYYGTNRKPEESKSDRRAT